MRNKFTILASIFLLTFFISSTLLSQNLVTTNSDFELWTDATTLTSGWTIVGGMTTTRIGAIPYAAQLIAGELTTDYIYQTLGSLTAGTVYDGSIDLDLVDAGSNGIQVGIYDASDNMVYSHEFTSVGTHTFSFTPTSSVVHQIRLAGGVGTTVTIDDASVTANAAPTATPTTAGTLEAGYVLTATPVLIDGEGNTPLTATYQWYRANTSTGTAGKEAISGATAATYTLTTADIAKYVMAEVTPYAGSGTSPGVATESDLGVYQGPIVLNNAPVGVINSLTAGGKQDAVLTADYTVTDVEDTPLATYQWYRSSDAAGVNKIAIGAATVGAAADGSIATGTPATHTLVFADVGKYIIFELTPTATPGVSPGTVVTDVTSLITGYVLGIPSTTLIADGATLVTVTPTFTWSQNIAGFDTPDNYELQVATDALFSNIVYEADEAYSGATESHPLVGSLASNTKHYWRVRGNLTSTTPETYSPWSQVKTFTTSPIDAAPTQTYPLSGNTVYTNTPTFYWYTGLYSTDQKFEVFYNTTNDAPTEYTVNVDPTVGVGGGTPVWVDYTVVGTDLFYEITAALTSGQDYSWWVRATDDDGIVVAPNYSVWSSMGEFTTATSNGGPVEPVGSYPTGGAIQYTNSPTLYWYVSTISTGLEFEIELNTTGVATGVATYDATTVGTSTYYQVSGLTSSTTYYWWVRSTDNSGNPGDPSAWSPRYSFVTTASSGDPVKPVLTHPVGGQEVYFADVDLYWYAVTAATDLKYDVYYSTSNTAPTVATVPTETGVTTTTTQITGLTASTTYYWWVRSTDNAGANPSDWSDEGSFITSATVAAVATPIQVYPIGGITVAGPDVELSWAYYGSGAGITYELRYSLYPGMVPLVGAANVVLADPSATTHTLTGLVTGTTFYWQVKAINNSLVESAWAGPASFSTQTTSAAPLVTPITGSPIANVVVDTDSPVLSWFIPVQSSGLTYDMEYSLNADYTNATSIKDIATSSVQLTNIDDGENYHWRVRSKATDGSVSSYSASGSFISPGITDVEETGIIPEKFEVSQNYPNPFNPSTVIKFSLPDAQFVTLRVYNMLGQEVATLMNKKVDAGVYNITWNGFSDSGTKVATGAYVYRVVAGKNVVTKKMLLLK